MDFKKDLEYKQLLKEQKQKREDLKTEIELKSFISSKTKIPFKVFLGGIPKFGYFGSIHFKDLFRESNLNKQELNEILDLFKPINMFMVRRGSLSFMPIEEKDAENIKINPYIIHFEGLDEDKIIIKWFYNINGLVYEIEAYINDMNFINEFASRTATRTEFKGGYRIENTKLFINGNFADGKYKSICWGRGSDIYKNDFTIYTEDLDTDFKDYLNT